MPYPVSATRGKNFGNIAAGNGLLNNLIAYWPGNEASGNALDLHTNALHLTDTSTVTSNLGLVYALARQYTAVNLEYHRRLSDDALLSAGDLDITLAAWVNLDSVGTTSKWIAAKRSGSGALSVGYQLLYSGSDTGGTNRFTFVALNAALNASAVATTFGLPVINTWYLVIASHDSVSDLVSIQVNNGTVDTTAYSGGIGDDTGSFVIGTLSSGSPNYYMNGRIGPTMFWKSAAGAGGVLTAAQRTALWNGGAGLTYAQFTT